MDVAQLLLLVAIVIMVGGLLWLVRRGRGPVAEGARMWAHATDQSVYVHAYVQAMRDVHDAKVVPTTDEGRRRWARQAFERTYIKRDGS